MSIHRNNEQSPHIGSYNQPDDISDDLLRETIRSLSTEQRFAFDVVLSWCRDS